MGLAAGALSSSNIGARSVSLTSAVATGGTTPYSYQWYRSTVSGFTPSGSNDLPGETELSFVDEDLTPGTQYYYKVITIDSAATPATVTSAQLSVLTLEADADLSQNQFQQSPFLGMLDLRYNPDTIPVQMDEGVTAEYSAGTPVKWTQDAGGVPKVEPCTADTDVVAGFITYNNKQQKFTGGDYMEMSMDQNVMYLMPTADIERGARVMIDVVTVGGVVTATTGKPVSGFMLDVGVQGQLGRVKLMTPALATAP